MKDSFLFLMFISFAMAGASLWLMQKTTAFFDLKRATVTSLWYITYICVIFLPSFTIYFFQPEPYRTAYMFSVQSVLITVPLGFLIANALLRFKGAEVLDYYSRSVEDDDPGKSRFYALMIVGLLAGAVTVSYFLRIETVPLFYLIAHPNKVQELMLLREEAFKLLDPRWSSSTSTAMFYVYLFLRTTIYPFLIMLTMGYCIMKRQAKWLALFLGTLLLGVFYAASSIARAPVAAIFLRIMLFIYIFKNGVLSKRALVILGVLVLLFPVLITAFAYGSFESISDLGLRLFKRTFYSPAWGLYYYFEIFPEHHGFVHGQTLLKPFLQFFTRGFFYVENYVYKYMSPNSSVSTGHENDAFISNLYADFGLAGVIAGGILVGLLMQAMQIYLLRGRKTVSNIAIFAFMIYAFWVLNFGSVTSVLFVNGVIPVLFLVWAIAFLEKIKYGK